MPDDEAKIAALADTAAKLGELAQHPSWPLLRAEMERKRQKVIGGLIARHLNHTLNAEPVNQREIDYWRAFFAGAEWLLDNPDHAEQAFEAAFKRSARERNQL